MADQNCIFCFEPTQVGKRHRKNGKVLFIICEDCLDKNVRLEDAANTIMMAVISSGR